MPATYKEVSHHDNGDLRQMIANFRYDHAADEDEATNPICWNCERPFEEDDQGFYDIERVALEDEITVPQQICETCGKQMIEDGELEPTHSMAAMIDAVVDMNRHKQS